MTTTNTQAPAATKAPIELRGIAETLDEGQGIWLTCSGCHESNEGHPTGPYSEAMRCTLGGGCSECGGIGAVWDTTDYNAMADAMWKTIDAPAATEAPSGYPPLPKPDRPEEHGIDHDNSVIASPDLFGEGQMRAYVDADRAARATPAPAVGASLTEPSDEYQDFALMSNRIMRAAANAFGYEGGLQTINEGDLMRFADCLSDPEQRTHSITSYTNGGEGLTDEARELNGLMLAVWACAKPQPDVPREKLEELLGKCLPYIRAAALASPAPSVGEPGELIAKIDELLSRATPLPWFRAVGGPEIALDDGRWAGNGGFQNVLKDTVEKFGGSAFGNADFMCALANAWPRIRVGLATPPAAPAVTEGASTVGAPQVPRNVLARIQAYGDSRADNNGMSHVYLGETITALREWAALAAPAAAVPESPAATNWKPIETAPKDGRDLLLRSLKGHVANGQWGQPAGWANPQCWVWPFINIEPAYWMEPLPEPRHD